MNDNLLFRDPTPEALEPPHMVGTPVKWEEYTNERMEYFYTDNQHAKTYVNNYRPLEVSFWANYFGKLAWDIDLHPRRDWERPDNNSKFKPLFS